MPRPLLSDDDGRRRAWAAWLKGRMAERGLSLGALAEACGVPKSTVQTWGEGADPALRHGIALARALGVSTRELLARAAGVGVFV